MLICVDSGGKHFHWNMELANYDGSGSYRCNGKCGGLPMALNTWHSIIGMIGPASEVGFLRWRYEVTYILRKMLK